MNKKSILFVLIFILSTLLIFRLNWILDFFNINDGSITRSIQFSGLLLTYSAIIIFWYTFETYKLRVLAERNNYGLLKVDLNNTIINFAGLEVARPESKTKFINIDLYVKNAGKGNLKILHAKSTSQSYKSGKNPNIKISGGDFCQNKNLIVQDTIRIDFLLEVEKWYKDTTTFRVTIRYEDIIGIYEQTVEFKNVCLSNKNDFEIKDLGKSIIDAKI